MLLYLEVFKFSILFALLNIVSTKIAQFLLKNKKYDSINDMNYLIVKVGEKCVSTIHSTIVTYFSLKILMNSNFWLHRISFISDESIFLSHFACGYFLYDVIMCLVRFKYVGLVFLCHAILAFVINLISIISNVGHFYTAAFLVWETSTPFINIRYFMHKLKVYKFEKVNNAMIILIFFTFRIIWGSFIYYIIIIDTLKYGNGILLKTPIFITFFMNALNYYWFYKMIKIVYSMIYNNRYNLYAIDSAQ